MSSSNQQAAAQTGTNAQNQQAASNQPGASLGLQTLIYFDLFYSAIYFILEYGIYIFKGFSYTYPPTVLAIEVVALTFFLFYQYVRLWLGSNGNKTESSGDIVLFLALTVPAIIAFIFYLRLQTYTLLIEVILNAIGLFFTCSQVPFSLIALLSFKSQEKYQ